MPKSLDLDRSPFDRPESAAPLRVPHARILAALMPDYPEQPRELWPLVNRAQLGVRAGYTAISGTVTRALNGIRAGSSSGDPHLGLLALEFVEGVVLDVEGVSEVNYRATPAGRAAYERHQRATGGREAPVKDKRRATNKRYLNKKE